MRRAGDCPAMNSRNGRLIFLAWDAFHAAVFDAISIEYPSAQYFPINQKAAAPVLEARNGLDLPPFWTLYSAADLDRIDRSADSYVAQWGETPEYELNIARGWIWARECAHLNNLLDALERLLGEKPSYLVPQGINDRRTSWHDGFLAPIAAMRIRAAGGARVDWVKLPDSIRESVRDESWEFPRELPSGTAWILLSTFALPDLMHHVSVLLQGHSATIRLLVDPSDPLPQAVLDSVLIRSNPRVQIIWMGRDLSDHGCGDQGDGIWTMDRWIINTGPACGKLMKQLGLVVNEPHLQSCIVSDHHSPQTAVLRELCSEIGVPVYYIPHSTWPMQGAFSALRGADPKNSIFFAATRRGVKHLSAHYGALVNRRPMPSPRYTPMIGRFWRKTKSLLCGSVRTELNIGIVITSGEDLSAPDIPVFDLAADLDLLIATIRSTSRMVNIFIRLRENEDRPAVFRFLSDSARHHSITWESTADRTSMAFIREMDLVIELGTWGSMMFENFSQFTPYLHVGGGGARRTGYAVSGPVVPCIRADGIGKGIPPYIESVWRRNALAVIQYGYFLTQTFPKAELATAIEFSSH